MLSARDLTIGYDPGKSLIKGISFDCTPGQMIVLLGVNGIGKSTLLRTLCGLIDPIEGSVSYDGQDIFGISPADRATLISGVFTGRDFDAFISVREFVALGRYPYTGWLGTLSTDDDAKIDTALATMGLQALAAQKVLRISDGERQKALIAKSLAQDTPVIIMDEPTAFLDYKNKAELLDTIRRLCTQLKKIILLSTHDIAASLSYSDRAFMITESARFREERNDNYSEKYLKSIMESH